MLYFDIEDTGTYTLAWSDYKDGWLPGQTDVTITLLDADRANVIEGISDADSGFSIPVVLTLNSGRYFVEIDSFTGVGPISCGVTLYEN